MTIIASEQPSEPAVEPIKPENLQMEAPQEVCQGAPQVSHPEPPKPDKPPLIEPAKVSICVMAYRCQPHRFLQDWLDGLRSVGTPAQGGYLIRWGLEQYGIAEAREINCNRFMSEDVPAGREYLIMVDADVVPLGSQSDGILRGDAELAYCGHCSHDGSIGHVGDGNFGAAMCRIHRSVFERVKKPWWRMVFMADKRVQCECHYLRGKAAGVGIASRMVGAVGHQVSVISVPVGLSQTRIYSEPHLASVLKSQT